MHSHAVPKYINHIKPRCSQASKIKQKPIQSWSCAYTYQSENGLTIFILNGTMVVEQYCSKSSTVPAAVIQHNFEWKPKHLLGSSVLKHVYTMRNMTAHIHTAFVLTEKHNRP